MVLDENGTAVSTDRPRYSSHLSPSYEYTRQSNLLGNVVVTTTPMMMMMMRKRKKTPTTLAVALLRSLKHPVQKRKMMINQR
jgi:hypothetical protein